MPHSRPRYAEKLIQKALSHSPIVGILGQRQVGKTTLAVKLSREYVTFDIAARLEQATAQPSEFLENRQCPFAIDEAQLCPPLFPAAKEWVRTHPRKGQLIMTGSVRFTSRSVIRESLTGRIVNVEILPMTVSEMNSRPLTNHLSNVLAIENSDQLTTFQAGSATRRADRFWQYLDTGGLPGVCFFRDETVRNERIESHLDTILNRDLKLLVATTLSSLQLRKLAAFMAENQGSPLELKAAAAACQSTTVTVKKILQAFEGVFLIRPVANEGSVAKVSYFFEDQGLATYLAKSRTSETTDILRGLYANLRQELHYQPHPKNQVFSYHTHDGTSVPLAFRFAQGTIGLIPSDERTPTLKALGSARSFLKKFPDSKVVIACKTKEPETRDFRTLVIPYWTLV